MCRALVVGDHGLILLMGIGLAACAKPEVAHVPAADLGQGVVVADAVGGLCVSVQLDRWDVDHRAAMVAALQDMGVRELRHDLLWSYVESGRGHWDWTTEDTWVDAASTAGFELIAMTAYGNAWASSDPVADEFYPPDDPADFALFAGQAASRYAGQIERFEIWNEPNSGFRFWKVGDPPAVSGDPVGYAALFVPAAEAIHTAQPNAEVQIGGTFFLPMGIIGGAQFVAEAAASNPDLLDVADSLAYHPYTSYPPRVGPEESGGDAGELAIDEMSAEMRSVGDGLPLAITEAGWPAWGTVDEELQAAFLTRGFALAQADGIRDYCAYTLEDFEDTANPEGAFGLYRYGPELDLGQRKPAGDAYAEIASNIEGKDCNGRAESALGLPAGVYAVRWSGAGGTATVLWTTSGELSVTMPASETMCEEAQTVTVSESPVWVIEHVCYEAR